MIKRMLLYAATLAVCLPAAAQDLTTVTATKIQDGSGNLLSSGTIFFLPVDQQGNATPFRLGSGGQGEMKAVRCSILAGVITGTCKTPNTATTSPGPICLKTTVKDAAGSLVIYGVGYACVQPTGTTYNFDNFVPNSPPASGIINNSITGNVAINGNLSVTGTFTGSVSGTVSSFSAGNLSPLFSTSVATATSTPALSFALSNAPANTVFGNNTASSAAPSYQTSISVSGSLAAGTTVAAGTSVSAGTSISAGTSVSAGTSLTVGSGTPILKYAETNETYAFGVIAAQTCSDDTNVITISGAADGDTFIVTAPDAQQATNQPVTFHASYITAASEIRLKACNFGSTAVTVASRTYRIAVIHH